MQSTLTPDPPRGANFTEVLPRFTLPASRVRAGRFSSGQFGSVARVLRTVASASRGSKSSFRLNKKATPKKRVVQRNVRS